MTSTCGASTITTQTWAQGLTRLAVDCNVTGCTNPLESLLQPHRLCLEHFLGDVQDRCHRLARRLQEESLSEALQRETSQFVIFAAAKIASLGVTHPPASQLLRGKMLNAMLLLADLREQLDRIGAQVAESQQ